MRYFIGFMLLINLLYGNLHRYDDSEYIDEINEEEYQGAYDDSDDEYRPTHTTINPQDLSIIESFAPIKKKEAMRCIMMLYVLAMKIG